MKHHENDPYRLPFVQQLAYIALCSASCSSSSSGESAGQRFDFWEEGQESACYLGTISPQGSSEEGLLSIDFSLDQRGFLFADLQPFFPDSKDFVTPLEATFEVSAGDDKSFFSSWIGFGGAGTLATPYQVRRETGNLHFGESPLEIEADGFSGSITPEMLNIDFATVLQLKPDELENSQVPFVGTMTARRVGSTASEECGENPALNPIWTLEDMVIDAFPQAKSFLEEAAQDYDAELEGLTLLDRIIIEPQSLSRNNLRQNEDFEVGLWFKKQLRLSASPDEADGPYIEIIAIIDYGGFFANNGVIRNYLMLNVSEEELSTEDYFDSDFATRRAASYLSVAEALDVSWEELERKIAESTCLDAPKDPDKTLDELHISIPFLEPTVIEASRDGCASVTIDRL